MRRGKGWSSIRVKMLTYFCLLFAFIVIAIQLAELYGIPALGLEGEIKSRQGEMLRNLNVLADTKKHQLIHWLDERKADIDHFQDNEPFKTALSQLYPIIYPPHPPGPNEAPGPVWKKLRKHAAYTGLLRLMNQFKNSHRLYKRIHVAEAPGGNILFSTEPADVGQNIKGRRYFSHPIFTREIHLEVVQYGEPGNFDLYLSRAVMARTNHREPLLTPKWVVVIVIDLTDFIQPLLHTGSGLGRTGEAILVDHQARILAPLKFSPPDLGATPLLPYRMFTRPARLASGGQEGLIEAEDYRGETVLAAFRHIRITAGLGWGLMVKRDKAEVFAPLSQSLFIASLTGGLGILLIFVMAIIISGNLSRPIRQLAHAARNVEAGQLDTRAHINGSGETAVLAQTFNSMVQRIQDWRRELEKEVENRTAQLNHANQSLLDSQERYKESTENLQDLVYIASHDLQTPLVSMVGFAAHLDKKFSADLPEEAAFALKRIKANAQRMHQLVLSLLDISRLNTVKHPRTKFSPNHLLTGIVDELALTIKEKGAEIEIKEMPAMVGDRQRLAMVFRNLLTNSLLYGATHIAIGFDVHRSAYFIVDNGIGISKHNLQRIFKPGERLKKTQEEGVGMGLAFCKKVIQQHGGVICAESDGETKGAAFYFTLPYPHNNTKNEKTLKKETRQNDDNKT